ncbi:MAG TPA: hypothetical protein VLW17_01745 [Thermoanaerobaculaceae bacterium]|nr:hypothetical protein [Thermoanaerobaculaceae bacterium]
MCSPRGWRAAPIPPNRELILTSRAGSWLAVALALAAVAVPRAVSAQAAPGSIEIGDSFG